MDQNKDNEPTNGEQLLLLFLLIILFSTYNISDFW